mmetsp:Transcript_34323/g.38429  ORF Transcript_34323/g.38429 Transcript_34323/m.38429 type:complete len:936 (-) Transcript_34323:72-2879(-)
MFRLEEEDGNNSTLFTATTLSLCLSAVTHSFILFSSFPYAGYMAVTLLNNSNDRTEDSNMITVDNVGIYAGVLGSVSTIGRFFGFVPWKFIRNKLGGKHSLMLSLFLTGLSSIWVGMAQTYSSVVLARFVQGITNCISGCVKRAAINASHNYNINEMRTKFRNSNSNESLLLLLHDEKTKTVAAKAKEEIGSTGSVGVGSGNAQTLILSIMWWGTALGPIIGGLLSDPRFLLFVGFINLDDISSSSDSNLPAEGGATETNNWFTSYPYLLPNLFSAVLCWLSMICVALFTKSTPLTPTSTTIPIPANKDDDEYGGLMSTLIQVGETRPLLAPPIRTVKGSLNPLMQLWNSFLKLWNNNKAAKSHLIAYFSFSFVVVCIDEALPLFLIMNKDCTGFGLSEAHIGGLLSASAIIVAVFHHYALVEHLFDVSTGNKNGTNDGMYRTLNTGAIFGIVPAVFIPLCLLLNNTNSSNTNNNSDSNSNSAISTLLGMTSSSFLFLVALVAVLRASATVYFGSIGVATSKTLRVVQRDDASRIMTMGTLLIRSLAPITAGAVVSEFMSSCSYWTVWTVIGLFFGSAAAAMTVRLGNGNISGGSSGGILLSEQQRTYLAKKGKRFTKLLEKYDEKETTKASSIGTRMKHYICRFSSLSQKMGTRDDSSAVTSTTDAKDDTSMRWKDHIIAPGVDFDKVSFFIIGTHNNDKPCMPHVLHPSIMHALQNHLPLCCESSNFWLKYSMVRDGASAYSLEVKSGLAKHTVMAVETLNGDVFGCFMSKPWIKTNNQYRVCGESFLWRMKKRRTATENPELEVIDGNDCIDVYPWTGKNEFCQLFDNDNIACGGGIVDAGDGFGIILNSDLLSGSSSSCITYGNPSLVTLDGEQLSHDGNQFEVANIEVWALTPYMFVADAEKSENSLKFLRDNSFNEETPSTTSAWSNFL